MWKRFDHRSVTELAGYGNNTRGNNTRATVDYWRLLIGLDFMTNRLCVSGPFALHDASNSDDVTCSIAPWVRPALSCKEIVGEN